MAHAVAVGEHEAAGSVESPFVYGIMAEFEQADEILAAARQVYRAGYRRIDAYTPFPVEELDTYLGFRDTLVPYIMLVGGILGAIGGFALLYWCTVITYPMNVGGR